MSDLTKIGALWRKTSKSGGVFFSGSLDAEKVKSALVGGDTRLLVFPVKQKRERGPDLGLFAAPDTRDPNWKNHQRDEARPVDDDDIGF